MGFLGCRKQENEKPSLNPKPQDFSVWSFAELRLRVLGQPTFMKPLLGFRVEGFTGLGLRGRV